MPKQPLKRASVHATGAKDLPGCLEQSCKLVWPRPEGDFPVPAIDDHPERNEHFPRLVLVRPEAFLLQFSFEPSQEGVRLCPGGRPGGSFDDYRKIVQVTERGPLFEGHSSAPVVQFGFASEACLIDDKLENALGKKRGPRETHGQATATQGIRALWPLHPATPLGLQKPPYVSHIHAVQNYVLFEAFRHT